MNEIAETNASELFAPIIAAAEIAVKAFRAIVEAIKEAARLICEMFDNFLRACFPKWWHISQYHKKKRIRKKYRDKMLKELRRWLK